MENQTNEENEFITLDKIKDIRKNIGFHFTSWQNLESILEIGLQPRIGDNSSGLLGKSSIPKPYMSYGLEGVMQLYNKMLNKALVEEIEAFQGPSYKYFLPNSTETKDLTSKLTILEGFEFIRMYMENNTYLIFDATMSDYEHNLEDFEIDEINNKIFTLEDENSRNISEQIEKLEKEIKKLTKDRNSDHKEEINSCVNKKRELVTEIYERTLKDVKSKQGKLLNGNETIVINKIEFDDESLEWRNFEKNPRNTHTRMIKNQKGELLGIPITPESIHQFSVDGKTASNGVQFLKEMFKLIKQSDKCIGEENNDVNLLYKFYEYVKLIEKYKSENPELLVKKPSETIELDDGTFITYPATFTIDLENISKYPGLKEFADENSKWYEEEKEKIYEENSRKIAESKRNSKANNKSEYSSIFSEQEIGKSTIDVSRKAKEETWNMISKDINFQDKINETDLHN